MYDYYSLVMTSKGEWVVGDTLNTKGLNNEYYKSKYQRQLQVGRGKWLKKTQSLTKNLFDIKDERERDAHYFRQQIEQKERVEAEKELEVQRYVHQLQEKERQNTESKYTQLTS